MPKGVTYNQTQANQAEAIADAIKSSGTFLGATSAKILKLETSATGTQFVAFESWACSSLDLINYSGTDIEFKYFGQTETLKIPNNSGRLIDGINNANKVLVRCVNTSNTQVTVKGVARS